MLIDISIGEVLDKISILDIKKTKIQNPEKLAAINKEMSSLSDSRKYIAEFPYSFWYSLLVNVNTSIWELTDTVKTVNPSEEYEKFALLSNKIFNLNQERFRLKDRFNKAYTSDIQEQKSYETSTLEIHVDNLETFYNKLSEINEKSLKYDRIIIVSSFKNDIEKIYNKSPFSIVDREPSSSSVNIASLVHEDEKSKYMFPPISYVAGGRTGDFILSLSVVNEMFLKTGRKGNVFLENRGDTFLFPLLEVYNDTYPVISQQVYINSYSIYSNNPYDIDLTLWRTSPFMYKGTWSDVYSSTYGIEWGKHKWLSVPEHPELNNYIFIHSSVRRINTSYNYKEEMMKNPEKSFAFISNDINEYAAFIHRTGLTDIPFLKADSFQLMCILIYNCSFFIGNLSMPSAIADALFKTRHTLLENYNPDNSFVENLTKIWNTVTYYKEQQFNYYSQFGEDIFMGSLFPKGYIGTCVEVGAYDGRTGSNTLSFEERGWKCVCVEPLPVHFEKCKSIRKYVVNCCISDTNKEDIPFYIFELNDGNQSAISSLEPDQRLIDSHSHLIRKGGQVIRVKCRTLTSVLDEANFPHEIDFISIDTENTEINVLKGFDFSKYKVKYLIIENNYNESICEEYLSSLGFKKFRRHEVNDYYMNINAIDINTHPYRNNIQLTYSVYHGEEQQGKCVDQTLREYFPNFLYNGIFLDVGAYEPINISNSYHFERNGWNVICFEANTDLIPGLKEKRKNVYNYAISNESKEYIEFNVVDGCWGGGSLTAGVSAIDLDPEYVKTFGYGIKNIRKIKVPQRSLNDCLPEILNNSTNIDIMSIDVEGGELNVLKGLDLNKYTVKVFVIENVFSNKNIGEYLSSFNYILDKRIDYNEYYIKKV